MQQPARILIVNQYFPPDTSATAKMVYNLSLKLSKDYYVTILCGRPSYNPTERHHFYFCRVFDIGSNIRVVRVASTTKNRMDMKGRLMNYFSYLLMACLIGIRLKPNLVVSMTDPPVAYLAGMLISHHLRTPFIYYINDFHPDMAINAGLLRISPGVRVWDKLHRWVLRRADAVVVLGEDMKRKAVTKGADPDKITVVRTGTYLNSNNYPSSDSEFIKHLRNGFAFVLGYAGNLGFAGAWETLIKAIKSIEDDKIGFVFIGEGPEKPRIVEALKGRSNVKFFPFQPEEKLVSVLMSPDVHLISLKKSLEGLVVPSKLYQVLSVGKPVIAIAPEGSDVAKIVTESRCGIVVDPDDPEELVRVIRYMKSNPEILEGLGRSGQVSSGAFDMEVSFQELKKVISNFLPI
jgi:colanic acid biosynthesis glycosyl transferase WcaI